MDCVRSRQSGSSAVGSDAHEIVLMWPLNVAVEFFGVKEISDKSQRKLLR